MIQRLTERASSLIDSVLVPFSSPFKLGIDLGNRYEAENNTANLAAARKPKRPPRFFFKSKYLIPYSSMKAKLQMTIDVKDIESGVS